MDEVKRVSEALQALIASGSARTKMGFLRQVLPEIEAAQEAGITHEKILKTLNEQGFGVDSQKTYAAMLSRIRVKKNGPRRYSRAEVKKEVEDRQEPENSAFVPKEPGAPKRFDWDLEQNNTKKLW